MARFKFPALLALTAVSACGPLTNGLTPASNPSLYSANQPVVSRAEYAIDMNTTGGGLPEGERERLAAWLDSLGLGYGDSISVDSAYVDPETRRDVARVASRYGILLSDRAQGAGATVPPGLVRVVVSRTQASVPGCPHWRNPLIDISTKTSSNYGCAVNSNLAQMVADPNDLVLGQEDSGEHTGAAASKAIKTYRDRPQTGASGQVKSEVRGNN